MTNKQEPILNRVEMYQLALFIMGFIGLAVVTTYERDKADRRVEHMAETDSLTQVIQKRNRQVKMLLQRVRTLTKMEKQRVDWMVRAMMSETKDLTEARHVAHVIDNRVQHPSFPDTPREVILDCHGQYCAFSAFNYNRDTRYRYLNLTLDTAPDPQKYRQYRRVARRVLRETERDPTQGATHFYSPRSMRPAYSAPQWVYHYERVDTSIPTHRFRFYRMSAS